MFFAGSNVPATGRTSEPDECSPHPHTLSLKAFNVERRVQAVTKISNTAFGISAIFMILCKQRLFL
jgi:hypothetical protein